MSTYEYTEQQHDVASAAYNALERAGVSHREETPLGRAMRALLKHAELRQRDLDERAKQESEDDEPRTFRTFMSGGAEVTPWAELDAKQQSYWRKAYGDAREYFTRQLAPAPQVLDYGAPEPDYSTRWREPDGSVWKWESPSESVTGTAGWTPTTGPQAGLHFVWGSSRMTFPMTEVTDRG